MTPTTSSDGGPTAPTPVRFDDGHERAAASPAVVQGAQTAHKRGDDVDTRILATLVDLQARMAQMEISQQKLDEEERMMGAIESGMFHSALANGRAVLRCISMHSDIHRCVQVLDKAMRAC
ncbi:unnamed protein product [Peronospora farinosa]|uniref:Uncharacterized protein n=1 Tax=Peronospora farinosa TaxID=134698 RepID=A0AAV0T3K9_9STRA|nr:unnamed protein product [Peronospora farinosa]